MWYNKGKYINNGARNTEIPCAKNNPVRGYRALKLHKTRG